MSQQEPSEFEKFLLWCDAKNEEAGKKLIRWMWMNPHKDGEEAKVYIASHPERKEITGPTVFIGERLKIVYASPVRLPFIDPGEGAVVVHVAEIKGTLSDIFHLSDVEFVECDPNDYSHRRTLKGSQSEFRFFEGDNLTVEPKDRA